MKKKLKERLSIQLVKNPGGLVVFVILMFNILFILFSAAIISNLALSGTEKMNFFEAAFCTITMILDPGCISFVISDIGQAGVIAVIVCLVIVLVGMVAFTGSVIGYITNYISHFIDKANAGERKVRVSNHIIILNWNSRASEIVNDLMYCAEKQKVVVLVGNRKEEIQKEIDERLSDTVARENQAVNEKCRNMNFINRYLYKACHHFKKNITVIVKQGDVFSSKQLRDISIDDAKTVIILGNDINNTVCKYEHKDLIDSKTRGNVQTIKTLMQVADMTGAEESADNQQIIVEITDEWTKELVNKIIKSKQVEGECNIVPVYVNQVLGRLLSQFSLMPELNLAYRDLFSNKGTTFYAEEKSTKNEVEYIKTYLASHKHSIPLTFMNSNGTDYCYYSTDDEAFIEKESIIRHSNFKVKPNFDYWVSHKNIIILGHNSKCNDIMEGFMSFRNEWNRENDEIMRILVIDDEKNLKKMNYYKDYPFVIETVTADIYDKDLICSTIDRFVSSYDEDTSVLILSDDSALNENIDANALANLVYVQDIINQKIEEDPDYDLGKIDVIVEIIDPKHHDVVNSYSVNNVVISNRYISKMITQLGEKEALYDFYNDILSYDDIDGQQGDSKEIYAKKVHRYFDEIPEECSAYELVTALYDATTDPTLNNGKINPTLALGYVKHNGEMILFGGDLTELRVKLEPNDKIILFSSH